MDTIIRAINRLTGMTGLIGGWLVVPLIIFISFEVFSRYVLGSPTVWAFELGYMLTGANFLLGMAFTLREGKHIRIEIIYMHLPMRYKALIDTMTYVIIIIPVCSWLAFALFHYAVDAYVSGESTGMSAWSPIVWPFRAVFFTAFAVLILQAIAELLKCVALFFPQQVPVCQEARGEGG